MDVPDFNNRQLVRKYGSWMKVQVAFYDFLFDHAGEYTHAIQEAVAAGKWSDGEEEYDKSIAIIEETFTTPEAAWQSFLQSERS